MHEIHRYLPEIDLEEAASINDIFSRLDENQKKQFTDMYRMRRKDPQHILLFTLIGFLGLAGIQRFVIGQVVIGLIYIFTGGLCLIGTIIDIINYRTLAIDYNRKQAQVVLSYMRVW